MPSVEVIYSTTVNATADTLWGILTDISSWPDTKLISCEPLPHGHIEKGSSFVEERDGHKWQIIVTEVHKPNKICWNGKWSLLRSNHDWEFIEKGGKTTIVNREKVYGWMTLPLYLILKNRLARDNKKWNNDLKNRTEKI